MTIKNPWIGLASYEEPKNDGNDYLFCGRDEETLDLVRLIDNNLFITLYGSSGIGKTSLLRAGVIPILRRKDYFPFYVRLSQEQTEISYAEAIVRKLQGSGLTEEKSAATRHPDGNDRLYLWNYFATTRFIKDGREVYPVIILDQFEEVFREVDKAKAELLLTQIYCLLNDELEMPDEEGYSADTNYRFVASIREDFLFVLEDSIDENSLDLYKDNRYRLRPMKPEQARQVVLVPGKDCIEEGEKDAIAERIISLAKRPQSEDIDTLLLSIVCSGTYDKKMGERIASSDLAVWKNNPMEVYYQDAVNGLSASQIRYIQQHFIRDDGSRRRVDADDVKAALGEATYRQLTQGVNQLFAIGDKGQVELLHDQLGLAVFEERKDVEERERKWKQRRKYIRNIVIIAMIVVLCVFIFWFIQFRIMEKKMLENQSRFIAEKAKSISSNDSYLSRLLALEILPDNTLKPNRPYIVEAEMMLRKAAASNVGIVRGASHFAFFIHEGEHFVSKNNNRILIFETKTGCCIDTLDCPGYNGVSNIVFSPNGKYIASYDDNVIQLWDSLGRCVNNLCGHAMPVKSVSFNSKGNRIVSTSDDNTIRIWDVNGCCLDSINGFNPDKSSWRYGLVDAKYSPDDSFIISTTRGGYSCIYDSVGRCVDTLHGIYGFSITQIEFGADGKQIIGSNVKNILIWEWDGKNANCIDTIKAPDGSYKSVSFNKDGNYLITVSECLENDREMKRDSHFEYIVRVFDINERLVKQIDHDFSINSVSLSPDNKVILSATNKSVRLDHLFPNEEDALQYRDIPASSSKIQYALFSPNGRSILIPRGILDAGIGGGMKQYSSSHIFDGFSPDGKYVLAHSDNSLCVFDTLGNTVFQKPLNTRISYTTFCPDSKSVLAISNSTDSVLGSQNSSMFIWDITTTDSLIKTYANRMINYVCFNHSKPYDTLLLYYKGSNPDRIVLPRTIKTGRRYVSYAIPPGKVAFSPNDNYFAIQKQPSWIEIMERDNQMGFVHRTSVCPHYGANTIAFSPDEKFLLVATRASTLLYDVGTGEELLRLSPGREALSACFSPDGKCIMSVLSGGVIRIYDFPPLQDLIDQTRERFKDRPLTPEERRMYYLE